MRIAILDEVSAEAFADAYEFMSLAFVPEGELVPRERRNKDGSTETRMTDGKVELRTQLKCLRKEDGNPVGEEHNVFVSLLSQVEGGFIPGARYELVPPLYFTTWATNEGRAGTSIVADSAVAIS